MARRTNINWHGDNLLWRLRRSDADEVVRSDDADDDDDGGEDDDDGVPMVGKLQPRSQRFAVINSERSGLMA